MTAYYNEFEPFAAQWLRNLISEGHIAPGDVDERPIEEVKPDDLAGYTQCHFFAGIGGWSLALRLAGWPDDRPVWTGSCPCQPFSAAGKRKGTADKRHLWPVWQPLIAQCGPAVVFGEQVASKDGRTWLAGVRAEMEALGYAVGAADLCAAGAGEEAKGRIGYEDNSFEWQRVIVGAPHIRQRLWFVADRRLADAGCSVDERLRRSAEAPGTTGQVAGKAQKWERGGLALGTGGSSNRMANAYSGGCDQAWRREPETGDDGSERDCRAGRMDNSANSRCTRDRQRQTPETARDETRMFEPSGSGSSGRLVDPEQPGLEGYAGYVDDRNEPGRFDPQSDGSTAASGSYGFWSDFDLLPCIDGKARRIEPGVEPLAHGVSNRVGLLRGYGNAIVPQVAAEFIRAYDDRMTRTLRGLFE